MNADEAMKKAEETLCRFAWLAEGKKQNATDYQRLEDAVATALLSVDEQAEKRGYAKGVEAAARFADTHSWHGNREDGFRIEFYEYPQEGLTALGDAIRALLTEPVELPAIPGDSCSFCHGVILADTERWPYPACDDCYGKCLANAGVGERSGWRSLRMTEPPVAITFNDRPKPYVLAIDSKDRMSVGWAYRYSTGELGWTFAKPIGQPTHWMPLPTPPTTRGDESK